MDPKKGSPKMIPILHVRAWGIIGGFHVFWKFHAFTLCGLIFWISNLCAFRFRAGLGFWMRSYVVLGFWGIGVWICGFGVYDLRSGTGISLRV